MNPAFTRLTRRALGLSLALAAGLPALAQQDVVAPGEVRREGRAWVQEYRFEAPVRIRRMLRLRADLGAVVIRTGNVDKVMVRVVARAHTRDQARARQVFRRIRIRAREVRDGVVLLGEVSQQGRRSSGILNLEFEVTVPRRYDLNLQTGAGSIGIGALEGAVRAVTAGGNIIAEDISGRVTVRTAGGNIRLADIGNELEANTAGGYIRVGDVQGNADLQTSGGDIVAGRVKGMVDARTAGGNIVLQAAGGAINAHTAGGQINIGESGGAVQAQTAGGSVRVFGGRGPVDVRTAGGSIDLLDLGGAVRAVTAAGRIVALIRADQKTFAASHLETSYGDVKVYLPATLSLTINAVIDGARGHKIHSDFPLTIRGTGAVTQDRMRASGEINGGGEILLIRTVSGNIEILRLNEKILLQIQVQKRQIQERMRQRMLRWEERRVQNEKRKEKRRPQR